MQKKKTVIAFIVNRIVPTGPLFVVQDIISFLPRDQYCVHIVELRPSAPEAEDMRTLLIGRGCYLHSLGCSFGALELRTRMVSRKLEGLLRKINANIVHSHTYHPDLVTAYLVNSFNVITTQHNLSLEDFVRSKGFIMGNYMHHRLLLALTKHKHLVGITHFVKDYYRTRLPQSKKFDVVYNGISPFRFFPVTEEQRKDLRTRLSLRQDTFIMVVAGTLSLRKDPITILKAIYQLRDEGSLPERFLLLFLGDGPLSAHCMRYAKGLKGKVQFAGFVPQPELYMQAANASISASLSEGFGLNVAEAVFCGLPTITTTIGPLLELSNSISALRELRFAPKDVDGCAQAILKSIKTTLGEKEQKQFMQQLSAQRMSQEYKLLYQDLVAQKTKQKNNCI